MSRLEKLEEELYEKEAEKELEKRLKKRTFLPRSFKKLPTAWGPDKSIPGAESEPLSRILKLVIAGLILVFIAGGAVFIFLFLGTRGQEARIVILGRDEIESGEKVTVPFAFRNVSSQVLKEVEFSVVFPRDTVIFEDGIERQAPPRLTKRIEDLLPGEERTIEVQARFIGRERDEKVIEAILLYRPENLRARLSTKASKTIVINRVPLAISWEAPETLTQGQEVEVKITYTSNASLPFQNLSLRIGYPYGFTFKEANPAPATGDSTWYLGTLDSGESGVIRVKGIITGEEGEIKAFRAELGELDPLTQEWRSFSESSREIKIAVTPLFVKGFLNRNSGIIAPGESLEFSVRYRNNTQFVLQNITVKAFIESDILDFSSLIIREGGVFDARTRAIVWGPANIPALKSLAPGSGGEFLFNIKARARPLVRTANDKNLMVTLRTQISPAAIPPQLTGTKLEHEDTLSLKVSSLVLFSGKSLYRTSPFKNSGPLPPRVGKETTYTISWEIRNFNNDLDNVQIQATIPPNVVWKDTIFPSDARIVYDSGSGLVRWSVGAVKAGTGVITPALVGAFKVAITPSVLDINQSPTLINESTLTFRDSFTQEEREMKFNPITIELRQDPLTNFDQWKVLP